jgi:cation diffusion facilitator CzcD-associated flavoprotein CzcO
VDFTGKRVGVIGTGSTGIQAIPVIAASAAHLTVFQRTPNYSLPARNAPLTPEFKKYAKEHAEDIRKIMTSNTNGHGFYIEDKSALDVPEVAREVAPLTHTQAALQLKHLLGRNLEQPEFAWLKSRFADGVPAEQIKNLSVNNIYRQRNFPEDNNRRGQMIECQEAAF